MSRIAALVPIVALACTCASSSSPSPPRSESACEQDLEAAAGLVARNYPGYAARVASLGAALTASAFAHAQEDARRAADALQCDGVLRTWLATFREGHLSLHVPDERRPTGTKAVVIDESPRLTLTATAAYLRIPSFDFQHRAAIDSIVGDHGEEIGGRPLLVLDVRGNGGGSDSTFAPLLPYLATGSIHSAGAEVLATPENADAWERVAALVPADQEPLKRGILDVVARMRAVPGGFVTLGEDKDGQPFQARENPARVFIVVDRGCKSSCEELLVVARQSRKVKLVGTASGGVLDYANVRPFPLPSAEGRGLNLPTSRSKRLPAHPIDPDGLSPDIALDAEALALEGRDLVSALERLR